MVVKFLTGAGLVKVESVLFLQPQPCVRALKYARGLKHALGNKISIVFGYLYHTLNALYGHGDEAFDQMTKLRIDNLESDIEELVERHRPQLIHSHNAPDFLTVSAVEAVGDRLPIIHDCHEALSLRKTGYYAKDDDVKILEEYPEQEKTAVERSDGRIYVTDHVRSYIQERYDVNPEMDLVFLNYVSESVMPQNFREKLSAKDGEIHIVYIGTVTSRIEGCHYDLREIFKAISSHEVHVHLYVSLFGLQDKAYKELADGDRFIHHHGHLDQRTLLQEITQYDYGWAGFNTNEKNMKHVEAALPNKVMEYLACGLPILAFPHKSIRKFVEEHEVGFVFNDLNEMVNQLTDRESIRRVQENVSELRHRLTVERNIGAVIDFYEKILHIDRRCRYPGQCLIPDAIRGQREPARCSYSTDRVSGSSFPSVL